MAVASSPPDGLNATDIVPLPGPGPVKVVPTGVSAPPGATENTDTDPGPELAVASSPPDGLNATETGSRAWVGTGVPTAVSAPSAATENTDTVPSVELAVASNPPDGLNATEAGPTPVANGEPATAVNAGCASAPAAPANRPAHANPTTKTARRTPTPTITTSSTSRPDLGDTSRTRHSHERSRIITAHDRTDGWF